MYLQHGKTHAAHAANTSTLLASVTNVTVIAKATVKTMINPNLTKSGLAKKSTKMQATGISDEIDMLIRFAARLNLVSFGPTTPNSAIPAGLLYPDIISKARKTQENRVYVLPYPQARTC